MKQIAEINKERAVLAEKINNYELKKDEATSKFIAEITALKEQLG